MMGMHFGTCQVCFKLNPVIVKCCCCFFKNVFHPCLHQIHDLNRVVQEYYDTIIVITYKVMLSYIQQAPDMLYSFSFSYNSANLILKNKHFKLAKPKK